MGGRRSSSFCFCSIFKSCFSSGRDDDEYWEDSVSRRRIFASDEDRERWIAEPGIDRKASAFIAKYYANRVSDSEHHFFVFSAQYVVYESVLYSAHDINLEHV
ncbi:uncharacterized protein G2W53_011721 [Senna tora]|uniref:Uncharacterized protein n=1 Tax=Senna tora TaxID=362788 RepID=A0A834X3C8_9FABA|nr:uncharacterized protein G2W53_011721 [Senna tora]